LVDKFIARKRVLTIWCLI